jgi:hypothetical protein
MKLNLVKDFSTGVYDYNDMLSSFLALTSVNGRPPGTLTKAVYSRQEWCGSVMQLAWFDPGKIRTQLHSYFDGEGDRARELPYPASSLVEDAVHIWVRGWGGPQLGPGEQKAVQFLTSTEPGKGSLEWTTAQLKRSPVAKRIQVFNQFIEAEKFTVQVANGLTKDYYVERDAPRRILRWEFSNGEKGQLIRSVRMKYWELNKKGGEGALKDLGLIPRPLRTM